MELEGTRPMPLRAMQRELPKWRVEVDGPSSPNIDCFSHAVTHGMKALGKLAGIVDDADHEAASSGADRTRPEDYEHPEDIVRFAADLVVVALKIAQTCPSGAFDLERAVVERVREKNPPSADCAPETSQMTAAQIDALREAVLRSQVNLSWADTAALLRAVNGDRLDMTPGARDVLARAGEGAAR